MRATRLLRILLDQKQTVVRGFEFTKEGITVHVRPTTRRTRCGCCGRPGPGYDARPRRWRHLDFAGMRVSFEYAIRRVDCPSCGPTTELVPWAPHASWFTYDFEHTVALLAQKLDKTTVRELMGIAWETVGKVVQRVVDRVGPTDLLDGLTRIGIDEISYRRHHHYLTIVTDHVRRRVVWVGQGRNADTVRAFFDALGPERSSKLELVTVDLSGSFIAAVREKAPKANLVFDRFHVQRLAHDALDEVRRAQARELKGTDEAGALKHSRWALQKNPWNLTLPERQKLSEVQRTNYPLYRAYLLKESLCDILDGKQHNVARRRLDEWIGWAQRSRLDPFGRLGRTIKKHVDGIVEYVRTGLSNGRSEGVNSKVRTITKRSYGFASPSALTAYIFLCCSGIHLAPIRHYPA